MALLHQAEHVPVLPRRESVRLNWRLMLAMGGTTAFWLIVAQGVARLV